MPGLILWAFSISVENSIQNSRNIAPYFSSYPLTMIVTYLKQVIEHSPLTLSNCLLSFVYKERETNLWNVKLNNGEWNGKNRSNKQNLTNKVFRIYLEEIMKLHILDLETRLDPTRTIRETRMENISLIPEQDYETVFETKEDKLFSTYNRHFKFR